MVKQVGLVILVLGLAVTGPGFRDKIGPDDDVVPSRHPEIRPLEIVTSSVSRGLASLRSPRAVFNTGEGRRAEIRRAADDLFDVGDVARRARAALEGPETPARGRFAAGLLLGLGAASSRGR